MSIIRTESFPSELLFEGHPLSYDTERKSISLQVIQSENDLKQLQSEWNSLLEHSAANSIFLTWEWISTWWKYFHQRTKLWITTARLTSTSELVGIAPLGIRHHTKRTGMVERSLIFLGNGQAAPDHLDFIIRVGYEAIVGKSFARMIWKERHQWNQIRLEGLSSRSSVIHQLLQDYPHLYKKVDKTICPYLTLPNEWITLKKSLSKSMRYSIGRHERRLRKDYPGVVELKQVKQPDEIDSFISTLVKLHTVAQNRKNNEGLFSEQNMIEFHTEIAKIFLTKNWLRSYTLDVGRTSIAAIHCFQYNKIVSFYQSGFDLFWQRYSPGTQIMKHAIAEAIREGNVRFDFLRGEEEYKFKWTKEVAIDLSFTLPLSLHTRLEFNLKELGRKIRDRL